MHYFDQQYFVFELFFVLFRIYRFNFYSMDTITTFGITIYIGEKSEYDQNVFSSTNYPSIHKAKREITKMYLVVLI